jgi:phage gp46-like protein
MDADGDGHPHSGRAPGQLELTMDVRLRHTPDGGEIRIEGGRLDMGPGLATAAYLSLFGGNDDDSGIQADDPKQWWGNLVELDEQRFMRSETQHLLRSLPATSGNLRRIEEAAGRDLAWLVEADVADEVTPTASMPGINRVALDIEIRVGDERYRPRFEEEWVQR